MLPAVLRSVSGAIALTITGCVLLNSVSAQAQVSPHPGMLRYPDVSRSHIVFSYANDLWIVPREGGVASPLASPPGQEQMPRFSPDGKSVAFIGNYDGNRDLYTISLEGGVPMRVTHHPANEVLCDWTPQGLLFFSNGIAGMARQQQLFTVGAQGGMPERLPIPYGTNGAISEDGTWLAYTPHTIDNRTWKRYRGGMATDIWLFNLKDKTSKKITDWEGTDTQPMWHGSTVYYLSDQGDEHRLNIWAFDTKSGGKREQITRFKDYDVKWPAIGPGPGANSAGEIIFQNGSGLYLLDLGTKTSKPVNVTIPGDRPTIRAKSVNAADFMQGAGISATGKRAAVQARGDIWTCPAEEGSPRNLTRTDDLAERDPSWSPDGQWIAYFSDATGEYELYIAQSDGRGETKQLTKDGQAFRYSPIWSPDSKHILFTDKAGAMYLTTIEGGETKLIDTDPWANQPTVSWSHDNRWIAYDRTEDNNPLSSIWIYNVASGEKKKVTSGYFSDSGPTFDRKGDYLYFRSNRHFDPTYGDVGADTTFIYQGTGRLLAVPLRAEIEYPYAPKSDEEKWDKEQKGEDAEKDADKDKDSEKSDDAKKDDAENGDKKENGKDEKKDEAASKPAKDDGVSGTWSGSADTPDGVIQFTLSLTLNADKSVTGSLTSDVFSGAVSGTYDPDNKKLALSATLPNGETVTFDLTIDNNSLSGVAHSPDGDEVKVTATRKPPENGKDGKKVDDKDKPRKEVVIDFDGFEERAFILPPAAGQFGQLSVNDSNQLIYGRNAVGAGGPATGIYLFDLKDDKKEEKSVASGTTNFDISADGKKLLVIRGPKNASIQNAAAGATGKNLITDGMNVRIQPRDEWKQMFNEAWRLQRDFFYVPNMHGVDWPAIKEQYGRMLADCVTRDDVSYVISEMISELNVGHAYYSGGDVEDQPSVNVGLLGADFTLENGAFRIKDIIGGGAWDAEARSPLTMAAEVAPLEKPAKDDKAERKRPVVKEGDYLLAVNGVPMDITQDPWVPFIDTVGKVVILTISDNPVKDETARDILVKPIGSEGDLRYRAWAENRRAYVEQKTDGKVGYIHVPDTGQNGQNNLYRGFYGQMSKPALIVDDRWNGGGQIPTRFIELLNRPVTNYWARRDGHDWAWPPDSMQGPKCMLINGLAGSGGDAFPYYFKQAKVGPTIGMRTWGGLVGISGNPGLIDGGNVTVPTFGFYKTNGTWGVEGHGVDPDVQVIDDPALMVDGGDPQLDKAIDMMMQAIATNPYAPPKRPAPPERAGMGMREEDK